MKAQRVRQSTRSNQLRWTLIEWAATCGDENLYRSVLQALRGASDEKVHELYQRVVVQYPQAGAR